MEGNGDNEEAISGEGASERRVYRSGYAPRSQFVVQPGLNIRGDYNLDELRPKIRVSGVKEPLLVVVQDDGRLLVINGERRWLAHGQCLEEAAANDEEFAYPLLPWWETDDEGITDYTLTMLSTGDSGKRLTAYEQCVGIRRLHSHGMSLEAIAAETTFSITHVRDCCLEFARAIEEIAELVRREELSFSTAVRLLKVCETEADQIEQLRLGRLSLAAKGTTELKPSDFPALVESADRSAKKRAEKLAAEQREEAAREKEEKLQEATGATGGPTAETEAHEELEPLPLQLSAASAPAGATLAGGLALEATDVIEGGAALEDEGKAYGIFTLEGPESTRFCLWLAAVSRAALPEIGVTPSIKGLWKIQEYLRDEIDVEEMLEYLRNGG